MIDADEPSETREGIKEARLALRWSVDTAAHKAGCSPKTWTRAERGLPVRLSTLASIERALGDQDGSPTIVGDHALALADHIREGREQRGLTQAAAARAADVHRITWHGWENGQSQPGTHNYVHIERALGWERGRIKEICGGAPSPRPEAVADDGPVLWLADGSRWVSLAPDGLLDQLSRRDLLLVKALLGEAFRVIEGGDPAA